MYELINKILVSAENASVGENPWLALLDDSSVDLLQNNSVRFAKVDMYHYTMADPLWTIASKWLRGDEVIWWNRTFEEVLIRPVQLYDGSLAYASL